MKKLFSVILIISILLTGCTTTKWQNNNTIYTSIYPLYFITKSIVGDKYSVINIIPPSIEPHDWEPSTMDIAKMSKSKFVIYLGLNLDNWIEKVKSTESNTSYVKASDGVNIIGSGLNVNPHVWLSPLRTLKMAQNIRNALCKKDPANKNYYDFNYQKLREELLNLNNEYKKYTLNKNNKYIIVYHSAFDYLAADYGLKQISLTGLDEEQEPSPYKVTQMINFIKMHHIKYIFTEPLTSPKAMSVISQETGASILPLNPVEGLTKSQQKSGQNYITIMKENLNNIQKAIK